MERDPYRPEGPRLAEKDSGRTWFVDAPDMGSLVASQQLTQGDVIFVTEPPEYEGERETIIPLQVVSIDVPGVAATIVRLRFEHELN